MLREERDDERSGSLHPVGNVLAEGSSNDGLGELVLQPEIIEPCATGGMHGHPWGQARKARFSSDFCTVRSRSLFTLPRRATYTSVSTGVPKIDLADILKTWLVPAKTIVVMRAAIFLQRAEAIQNHSLKVERSPKAVM